MRRKRRCVRIQIAVLMLLMKFNLAEFNIIRKLHLELRGQLSHLQVQHI